MSEIGEKLSSANNKSNMGLEFKANESNTYTDYFSAYFSEYRSNGKTKEDVYREHLQTASKNKLVDIAMEGHEKYQWANSLAYERGIEIEKLNEKVTYYNNMAYNSNLACLISIISCVTIVGVFYIYQFIKFRLRKYAEKIRIQTIEELKSKD